MKKIKIILELIVTMPILILVCVVHIPHYFVTGKTLVFESAYNYIHEQILNK